MRFDLAEFFRMHEKLAIPRRESIGRAVENRAALLS